MFFHCTESFSIDVNVGIDRANTHFASFDLHMTLNQFHNIFNTDQLFVAVSTIFHIFETTSARCANEPTMTPSARPPIVTADPKLAVLSSQRQIEPLLNAAITKLETSSNAEIKQCLLTIKDDFSAIGNFLSASIEPKYYAHHRLPDSIIATKHSRFRSYSRTSSTT